MKYINLFVKTTILLIFMLQTVCFSAEDYRIKEELASSQPKIPLKNAMGDEAYNKAMNSGEYYYVGNTKCRLCHRKFFLGRKKDPHDFAMESLIASGHEENPRCLTCHSTGHGVKSGFTSIKKTPRLSNVQCEGCHGPGNVHIRLIKEKKRWGFLTGTDKPKRLKKMCQSCHTKRWDRSYHDLKKAYDKYRNADPNSKVKK